MANGVGREVLVAVLGAAAVGAATLAWNWTSSGGVVRALGGVTSADVQSLIDKSRIPIPPGPPIPLESLLTIRTTDSPIETALNDNHNAGISTKCDRGIIVGGSCNLVKGSGKLYNSGVAADRFGCTWGDTDPNFVGHVRATCLQIEKK